MSIINYTLFHESQSSFNFSTWTVSSKSPFCRSLCVGTSLSSDGGESNEYVNDDEDDDTDERSALLEVDPVAAQK